MFNHDKFCMGSKALGMCDCDIIKKIRNDQHYLSYSLGFNNAKNKYKSKYKKKLKKIKDNETR